MSRGQTISLNPKVMRWARESRGYSLAEAADRLKFNEDDIEAIEKGLKEPTISDLKKMATGYKRPIATLLLPKPPQEFIPKDHRTLPGTAQLPLSPETRLAVRRARRMQSMAGDIVSTTGHRWNFRAPSIDRKKKPNAVAELFRREVETTTEEQFGWRDSYQAYGKWRRIIEDYGVLTMQERMPIKQSRGFALSTEGQIPVIVTNASDFVNARIFTLFHELSHVLLNTDSLCGTDEVVLSEDSLERFCNAFAGAFLVPGNDLEALIDKKNLMIIEDDEIVDGNLSYLANKFHVSREVVLNRLKYCQMISEDQYRDKLPVLHKSFKKQTPGGGGTRAELALREKGTRFVSLVLGAVDNNTLSSAEASDYLSVQLSDLGLLQQAISRTR